jgi:hypothetical protein
MSQVNMLAAMDELNRTLHLVVNRIHHQARKLAAGKEDSMSDAKPRTRGRQAVFFGPRRRTKIIQAIHAVGSWSGRRGPMRIAIKLDMQPTLEHEQISFTVSMFRERSKGTAGTVVEAIEKLEQLFRDRTLEEARASRKKETKK